MKYSLILIAGLALAGCNLETPPPTETTQQTSTVGLQFASMPVGLEAHSVNGDGEAFFMRYVGKQGLRNPEHSAGQSDDIRPPDPEYPATLGMPS